MKKLAALSLIPLSLLCMSASANVSQVNGDSICTVVGSISKAKAIVMPCTYTGSIGGSMTYGIEELDYKLPTGLKFSTLDNATFESDGNGGVKILEEATLLDDKPATVKNFINYKYVPISDKAIEKRYDKEPVDLSDILRCFVPDKAKDTAFCVPYYYDESIDDEVF